MLRAFALAFGQLLEPDLRWPLLRATLWSLGLFAIIWLAVGAGIASLSYETWIKTLVEFLGLLLVPIVSWLLFPTFVIAVLGFYAESIIVAVERRYYPGLPQPRRIPIMEIIWSTLRLLALGLITNIILLPIYLLVPGGNLVLFLALNGYVLGCGYFDQIAMRRWGDQDARRLWRDHRLSFVLAGAGLAGLALIPILNLAVPIIGLATMVHLVQLRASEGRDNVRL